MHPLSSKLITSTCTSHEGSNPGRLQFHNSLRPERSQSAKETTGDLSRRFMKFCCSRQMEKDSWPAQRCHRLLFVEALRVALFINAGWYYSRRRAAPFPDCRIHNLFMSQPVDQNRLYVIDLTTKKVFHPWLVMK